MLPRSRPTPDSAAGGPQYRPPGSGDHWDRGSGPRTLDQAPDPQNTQVSRPGRGILIIVQCFLQYIQLLSHDEVYKLTNFKVGTEYCESNGVMHDMSIAKQARSGLACMI